MIAIINVKLLQVDGKNFGIWQKCLILSVTYSTLLICCLAMQQHHSHAVCYYKYYPAMQIFRLRLLCVCEYIPELLCRNFAGEDERQQYSQMKTKGHRILHTTCLLNHLKSSSDSSFEEFQQVLKREKIIYTQFTQKCVG